VIGGGAVPVLFSVGCVEDVAWSDLEGLLAAGLDQAASFGYVKGLAALVGVPGGARAGGEMHCCDVEFGGQVALGDWVDPYISGEPFGRPFVAGLLRGVVPCRVPCQGWASSPWK